MSEFDQTRALAEGWCVIVNSEGWAEIQLHDEGPMFATSDEDAERHVRSRAAEGSGYHTRALLHVNAINNEVRTAGKEIPSGKIFMALRSWDKEAVQQVDIVSVRADYDPIDGPYGSPAVDFGVGSNQDLVDLQESAAVPDISFGNDGFIFGDIDVESTDTPNVLVCRCRNCDGEAFEADTTTESNMKIVIRLGQRLAVIRCPHCDALRGGPSAKDWRYRRVGTLMLENVNFALLEAQRLSLQKIVNEVEGHLGTLQGAIPGFTQEDADNLAGLELMLDNWSDKIYHRVEVQ